jgi:hypothetical protein
MVRGKQGCLLRDRKERFVMSSIREKIIEAAIEKTIFSPNGKASDLSGNKQDRCAGWRVLRSYFTEVVEDWSEKSKTLRLERKATLMMRFNLQVWRFNYVSFDTSH